MFPLKFGVIIFNVIFFNVNFWYQQVIPTHDLKEALVGASGLLMAGVVKIVYNVVKAFIF